MNVVSVFLICALLALPKLAGACSLQNLLACKDRLVLGPEVGRVSSVTRKKITGRSEPDDTPSQGAFYFLYHLKVKWMEPDDHEHPYFEVDYYCPYGDRCFVTSETDHYELGFPSSQSPRFAVGQIVDIRSLKKKGKILTFFNSDPAQKLAPWAAVEVDGKVHKDAICLHSDAYFPPTNVQSGDRISVTGLIYRPDLNQPMLDNAFLDPYGLIWGSLAARDGGLENFSWLQAAEYCRAIGARLPTTYEVETLVASMGIPQGVIRFDGYLFSSMTYDGREELIPGISTGKSFWTSDGIISGPQYLYGDYLRTSADKGLIGSTQINRGTHGVRCVVQKEGGQK